MRNTQLASCLIAVSLLGANQLARAADPAHPEQPAVAPAEAIAKLKEGNGRYASGKLQHPGQTTERRAELTKDQHPFAVIVSCSDSRVPPEIVFDQGLGDLFVVRVAGNVIDDHGLGSIEYAVDHLGARLIVVLGHQSCGAVKAAVETPAGKSLGPNLDYLIKAIRPAVERAASDVDAVGLRAAILANVEETINDLLEQSTILKHLAESGQVTLVGAYYELTTGRAHFSEPVRMPRGADTRASRH